MLMNQSGFPSSLINLSPDCCSKLDHLPALQWKLRLMQFAQLQRFEASLERKGTGNILPSHYHKNLQSILTFTALDAILHVCVPF